MRFAYLIAAHTGFDQIERLVKRLLGDASDDIVMLHVDGKCAIEDEALKALASSYPAGQVTIVPRIDCFWGHPSQCQVELLLMQALSGRNYDLAHFISGQDWPASSRPAMVSTVEPGACYISFETRRMTERMDDYHFYNHLLQQPPSTRNRKLMRGALLAASRLWTHAASALGRQRKCPFGPFWQRGPCWWSLPPDAVAFLTDKMAATLRNGRLRHTLCSDEHLPHSILFHSPFRERIRPNRRFMIWNGASPKVLAAEHLPLIEGSESWFARKVSLSRDPFFLAL